MTNDEIGSLVRISDIVNRKSYIKRQNKIDVLKKILRK
jgi:hypothetical protein